MIEERGANLSGGQRQRIAIARALATNPRILILDEATSALDYDSERIIQDNMRAIVRGRTVIIIAHRLAAVRPCSRIVGMQRGEIVEVGSHEELLRREGGLYAHLWALQIRSGEDAGMNERTAPPAEPLAAVPLPSRAGAGGLRPRPGVPARRARNPRVAAAAAAARADARRSARFALAALAWSFFGRLDVHAVAPGKIETAGYSKVIEPLDPGKVAAIHRRGGPAGQGGRPPVRARPGRGERRRAAAGDALNASRAEIARRRFAIEAVRSAEAEETRADAARPVDAATQKADARRTKPRRGRRSREPGRGARRPARARDRLGRGPAGVVPPARGGGAARRPRPARGRAEGARPADGAEARDPEAARHEHRLPAHADGHAERSASRPARRRSTCKSAPRSTSTTPRRSWRSRNRSSPPTRAS